MVEKTDIFDGASTPLEQGITLIEASAGTGKTFAISMLVLRAVVELGVDLKEILVVTYTVAATEELRGRIRSRLVQARNLLREERGQADPVLKHWLAGIDNRDAAGRQLDLALLDIDSMGIHTIHGFCQRILAEQVLESGHFFDTELISDTSAVRNNVIRDFWRRRLYPAEKRYGALIVGCYPTPTSLYQSIRGAENPLSKILPEELTLDNACHALDGGWERLKSWWIENGTRLEDELTAADQKGFLKAEPARKYRGWLESIDSSFSRGDSPDSAVVENLLEEHMVAAVNGNKVRGEEKKRALAAGWSLPGEAAENYLAGVDTLLLSVRLELAIHLREELTQRLHEQGLVSFDELIIYLAQAIRSADGKTLVSQVGGRYRVALIDEFQDTDSAQYEIFSTLFGKGAHHLYLIG
ncbi:MAG: UvrD-helicase domain-containing protein, partial [Desulfocapsaceae bacterium]